MHSHFDLSTYVSFQTKRRGCHYKHTYNYWQVEERELLQSSLLFKGPLHCDSQRRLEARRVCGALAPSLPPTVCRFNPKLFCSTTVDNAQFLGGGGESQTCVLLCTHVKDPLGVGNWRIVKAVFLAALAKFRYSPQHDNKSTQQDLALVATHQHKILPWHHNG